MHEHIHALTESINRSDTAETGSPSPGSTRVSGQVPASHDPDAILLYDVVLLLWLAAVYFPWRHGKACQTKKDALDVVITSAHHQSRLVFVWCKFSTERTHTPTIKHCHTY
ncbi:hypothetical protein Y032_0024g1082 [Ancylostoma ceylanicum]|uniref:Uncharacterized protein n=1 Tax=Ancylostoma ceylanicum TaxID=53326 RepID=A0A016UWS7_9BILA|nr:hypothetical protein Y032_0024g1082 [Ancylostoma ceylanicum]